jgi:serum/glucocorticoid-regulated kinase 2
MERDWDVLGVATHPHLLQLLRKYVKDGSSERVVWSSKELKINAVGRAQLRVLILTAAALYNLKPNNLSQFQRRIKLENIAAVTMLSERDEFVIHVPEEYDYRYKSPRRKDIVEVLSKLYKEKTCKKLKILDSTPEELETYTVTKLTVFQMSREEIIRRKKVLAAEEHDSDQEEANPDIQGPSSYLLEKVSITDFSLLKVLGRGAFGKVVLVRKNDTKKIYAMKILKKTMVVAKKQIEHTLAERKILESFQHPFLMGLRFAFQTESKLYLVMDFFKGGELFFHLRRKKLFSEPEARMFVAMIALALGRLHSLNFIYRDLVSFVA